MGFRVLSTRSTSEQVLQVDGLDHKVWEAAGAKKKRKKVLPCLAAAADKPQIILDVSKKKVLPLS